MKILSTRNAVEVADKLRIPHVPAKVVSSIKQIDANQKELLDFVTKGSPNTMLKFDFTASDNLKTLVRTGYWSRANLFDRRGLSFTESMTEKYGIYGSPEDLLIIERPWIEALQVKNYPVEYRVFIEDGEVVGISNRHLGAKLRLDNDHIEDMMFGSKRFANYVSRVPDVDWYDEKVYFTLDFIVDAKTNEALLLDSGLPYHEEHNKDARCFGPFHPEGIVLQNLGPNEQRSV